MCFVDSYSFICPLMFVMSSGCFQVLFLGLVGWERLEGWYFLSVVSQTSILESAWYFGGTAASARRLVIS